MKYWFRGFIYSMTKQKSGFHLDIESRDGNILVSRNKGWRGRKRVRSNNSKDGEWAQRDGGSDPRHPLNETLEMRNISMLKSTKKINLYSLYGHSPNSRIGNPKLVRPWPNRSYHVQWPCLVEWKCLQSFQHNVKKLPLHTKGGYKPLNPHHLDPLGGWWHRPQRFFRD